METELVQLRSQVAPDQEKNVDSVPEVINDGPVVRKLTGITWFIAIIIDTFGQIDLLTWVSVAYPLGELNVHFNNKILYLITLAIFEVGSAVIGSAQSMVAVIVGRTIAGFGGSGIYVCTVNIVSSLHDPGRAEPLHQLPTWRWAFYINVVIAGVTAPACVFLIPSVRPPQTRSSTWWQRLRRIDYVGEVLWLGGIVTVVTILSSGGALWDWGSPRLIGLYVAAGAAWILFWVQQRFSILTSDRIFPLELAGRWHMVLLFCCGGPLGPLFPKFSVYKVWFLCASVLMLVAAGLLSTIDYGTPRAAIMGYTVIQGVGCGPVISLPFTVGQAKATTPRAKMATTGLLTCAQMAGLVLALGIATAVFLNRATDEIGALLSGAEFPRSLIQAAISGVGSSVFDNLDPDTRRKVSAIVARNVGKVFYLNVAGSALGFVTAVLMKWETLDLSEEVEGGQ
ncbi:putative efflux pump antibiotic resistance protein [Xylariaceae sp. FL0594]|nr:putative efflux pump antibiotic resistance protein [Xylariaceae sp. FL0594]